VRRTLGIIAIFALVGATVLSGVTPGAKAEAIPCGTRIWDWDLTWDNRDVSIDGGNTSCTVEINGYHSFNSLTIKNNGYLTHHVADYYGNYFSSQDYFIIKWEGYIYTETAGNWSFTFNPLDNEGRLRINDAWIIGNDNTWQPNNSSGTAALSVGFNKIEVEMAENEGASRVTLLWREPGGSTYKPIPGNNFFHLVDTSYMFGLTGTMYYESTLGYNVVGPWPSYQNVVEGYQFLQTSPIDYNWGNDVPVFSGSNTRVKMDLSVAGPVTVQSGGNIDVHAKGIRGGLVDGRLGGGYGGGGGEDSCGWLPCENNGGDGGTTDNYNLRGSGGGGGNNANPLAGGGGGYGGYGGGGYWRGGGGGAGYGGQRGSWSNSGTSNKDSFQNNTNSIVDGSLILGSGGGGGNSAGKNHGGAGGGSLKIVTPSIITVAGTVSANGEDGGTGNNGAAGGGAGGSIFLKASQGVFVPGGSIWAAGGNGGVGLLWGTETQQGGGGGGGIIVIYIADISVNVANQIMVSGGQGARNGEAGIIFVQTQPLNIGAISVIKTSYGTLSDAQNGTNQTATFNSGSTVYIKLELKNLGAMIIRDKLIPGAVNIINDTPGGGVCINSPPTCAEGYIQWNTNGRNVFIYHFTAP
jgi:hypothetical protein